MNDHYFIRIKPGTKICQDRRSLEFPQCVPPQQEYPDRPYEYVTIFPRRVFIGSVSNHDSQSWECKANGYGFGVLPKSIIVKEANSSLTYVIDAEGDYGNGSILAFPTDDQIEYCTYQDYVESEQLRKDFIHKVIPCNNQDLSITKISISPPQVKIRARVEFQDGTHQEVESVYEPQAVVIDGVLKIVNKTM